MFLKPCKKCKRTHVENILFLTRVMKLTWCKCSGGIWCSACSAFICWDDIITFFLARAPPPPPTHSPTHLCLCMENQVPTSRLKNIQSVILMITFWSSFRHPECTRYTCLEPPPPPPPPPSCLCMENQVPTSRLKNIQSVILMITFWSSFRHPECTRYTCLECLKEFMW